MFPFQQSRGCQQHSCCSVSVMSSMDRVSFVRSLELADQAPELEAIQKRSATASPVKYTDQKPAGYANAGSLVSFTSQLKGQQKKDVLNSSLLAQLAASKKFNRFTDINNWYEYYTKVMGTVGWVIQSFNFDKYHSDTESFTISKLLLKILADIAGGDKKLIKVVQDTLESLAKSADGTELFGSSSSSHDTGNFQIMPCNVDKSNQVQVSFIASHFKASQTSHNYLFVTVSKEDISLYKAVQIFTLDEEVYAQVREEVVKKLGHNAKDKIKDLDI